MIGPSGAVRVMLATRPVDFRKGADGLAVLVRDALGTAALAALRSKDTYLAAQYQRLVRRLGSKQKALVALQHSILVSVWHMLSADSDYRDTGADHFLRRDPDRERRRAIATLNKLGYTVTLNPLEPTQIAV